MNDNHDLFVSQKDSRWKDVKLIEGKDYTIGSSGCLITSLTNCYNLSNYINAECKHCLILDTPATMLERLKQYKAINQDGLVIWSAAEKALNMEVQPFDAIPDPYFNYQICQFVNNGYAHFSNLIKYTENEVLIYDVYSGTLRELLKNQVRRYINLRFRS